ncbi:MULTISPECIES: enoyl-CoA hydratase/isomerase family protein [Acidovorax]|uniref:enoyl-CoA hydratase/isomerase family protein n=1 Tax=Acidovorax TaxID=12916 RepID=UPI0032B27C0A
MDGQLVLIEDWQTSAGVRVRVITLNRPEKANAMNVEMMKGVAAAVAGSRADVNVLRSASERVFCAGADIAQFVSGEAALAEQEHALLEMLGELAASTVPLVAVAQGKAAGAGAMLLAMADVVLAAEDVEVACPEMRFGMYPVIVEAVLQSRISAALASRMCFGHSLSAQEACGVGLVTEVLALSEFASLSSERLDFYLLRSKGLAVARKSRLLSQPANVLLRRLDEVAPLMSENYGAAGVRERIASYLAGMGRRS